MKSIQRLCVAIEGCTIMHRSPPEVKAGAVKDVPIHACLCVCFFFKKSPEGLYIFMAISCI
jgi:hypothetical protein